MKFVTMSALIFAALLVAGCEDTESVQERAQQNAIDDGSELLADYNTAIDYAERVTAILKQVVDDESAQDAIAQIDAMAQARTTYNDVKRTPFFVGSDEQVKQLEATQERLNSTLLEMKQEIQRIIFSGEGGSAIPKTGPMREVTRAVNVGKPERRP